MRDQHQDKFTLAGFSQRDEFLSPQNHPILSKERLSHDKNAAREIRESNVSKGRPSKDDASVEGARQSENVDLISHSRSSSYLTYGQIGVGTGRDTTKKIDKAKNMKNI